MDDITPNFALLAAPIATSAGSTTFTERGPQSEMPVAVAIDPLIEFTADPAAITSVRITVAGAGASEQLSFAPDPATMGDIELLGGAIGTISLHSSGGAATAAQWQAALRAVAYLTYRDDLPVDPPVTRTVTFQVLGSGFEGGSVSVTKELTLAGVNDAPVLSGAGFLSTVDEDAAASEMTRVGDLLDAMGWTDIDGTGPRGVAVIVNASEGNWQYSTDGETWFDVGEVSPVDALLLSEDSYLRYEPDGLHSGQMALIVRGWDASVGTATDGDDRQSGDTTSGSTAFASEAAPILITVTSQPDAPVLTPAAPELPATSEDAFATAAVMVADLMGDSLKNEYGSTVQGLVVTAASTEGGHWEYALSGSPTAWGRLDNVSVTSALALSSNDWLRFVPDHTIGTTATLSYYGWDGLASNHGNSFDASVRGGATEFSQAGDTVSVEITPVNDEPTGQVTFSGGVEGEVGDTLYAVDSFDDVDGYDGNTVAYTWLRDGTVIEGATYSSYTITEDDLGTTLTVEASYTDFGGTLETVGSSSFEVPDGQTPQPPQPPQEPEAPAPQGVNLVATPAGGTLTGTRYDDTFKGLGGRDVFVPLGGHDTIDGGAGIDRVVFAGDRDDYRITRGADGKLTVQSLVDANDVATLSGIERLTFGDSSYAVDLNRGTAEVVRLYWAALGRAPEAAGLEYYADAVGKGASLLQLAWGFLASPEFQQQYGGTSDSQFLTRLYSNAFGRDPDAAGLAYQLDVLQHQPGLAGRAQMLATFIEAPETQVKLAGLVEGGVELLAG